MAIKITVGMEVGAHRWSMESAHPDCWGKPWRGVVLAENDPRAWEDTLAFPGRLPTQEEVDRHIADLARRGLSTASRIPVLWDFGPHGQVMHREHDDGQTTPHSLRPYAQDFSEWVRARAEMCARYGAPLLRAVA